MNLRPYPITSHDEDQIDLLLTTTDIGLYEMDVATHQALRNLRHDQIFGYATLQPDWSLETFLSHVIAPERERVQGIIHAALANKSGMKFETEITRVDGSQGWISAKGITKLSKSGEVVKLLGHVIDITETKLNERRLRLLANEMDHRVKNTLAVVQSIANQTFRSENSDKLPYFMGRLTALAQAHDALLKSSWQGADFRTLVEKSLEPARDRNVHLAAACPTFDLDPQVAVAFSLALHELCTNAIKYGALSVEDGRIDIDWSVSEEPEILSFAWRETGGPRPAPDRARGFGTKMIQDALAYETNSEINLNFLEIGLEALIKVPMANIQTTQAED